ncbi:MAG: trimethylamine methyltransferase family protein, partial [Candidatus Glassbacteria bacterium]|nr:trimethylamine methyltransferase family protein [Candidatus Glassbacteria bacterium]
GRVGLRVEHDKVRERLLAAGAAAGKDNQTVRLPAEMVRDYLGQAPGTIRLSGLNGSVREVGPGKGSVYWTAAAMNLVGQQGRKEFDRAELARLSRLVDSLDNLDGVVGVSVSDVPPAFRDVAGYRTMSANTGKHVRVLSFSPDGALAILEMAEVLLDGKKFADNPVFSMGFTAHGPLRWTNLALDVYYRSAGHGIPVTVNGEPMAGGTSPVTLAGALTVGNAEILGGIVINQVLEPGRPCIHNLGFAHVMDMRSGLAVTGGPENCLLAAAGAALANFYGLPSASWISSDSMVADAQSAAEKTMAALTHTAAGIGVIWGAGTLESELSISFAQTVIDNEIIGQAKRFLRGIEVNPETIAEPLIEEVGPCGNYLATGHTMQHFRSEIYEPDIFCRLPRERWEEKGALPLQQAAEIRAGELIAASRPPELSPEALRELDKIEKAVMRK